MENRAAVRQPLYVYLAGAKQVAALGTKDNLFVETLGEKIGP